MWFHHPSQALPLTATVPGLSNGMERKARRAYRSVLDLVVATCTAALAGAMSVVPPDPRRVAAASGRHRDVPFSRNGQIKVFTNSGTPCIGVMGGLRGVNVNRVARSLSIVTARMGGLPDV